MAISRITKLINERTGAPTLGESRDARRIRLNISLNGGEPNKRAVMAHAATTLGLRTFTGPVVIHGDPRIPGVRGDALGDQLLELAKVYGEPERLQWGSGSPADGVTLSIGGTAGDFIANAAGWVSGINSHLPAHLAAEAPASVFAVSCAFAQLFNKTIFGIDSRHSWTFCVRELCVAPPLPTEHKPAPKDIGRAAVLGAGAIGSALAYTLWLSDWTGHIEILDRDSYDEPNLETTCLIGREQVVRCLPKAPALAAVAARPGLSARGQPVEVTASSPELLAPWSTFVCAVDNSETRRMLDSVAAEFLLNGAVGGSARDSGQVLFSRHGRSDPLLSTLYRERPPAPPHTPTSSHVPEEVRDECSRVSYEGVAAAAPFIATASGAMLAAACAGAPSGAPNYLKLDLFGLQHRVDRRLAPRR
jgi:molybdopterin/thiamine biosynthesis adenylyltransferase